MQAAARLDEGRPVRRSIRVAHLTSVHEALDGRIFSRECRSLARAGFDVVIIAPDAADGAIEGVRVVSVRAPRNRLERLFVTGPVITRAAVREACDIYHFHDPELMLCGLWLRLRGKRVVYDAHEDVRKDAASKGYVPRSLRTPLGYFAGVLSRLLTRAFDATVAAVPSIEGGVRGRCVVVYNYPVIDDLRAVPLPDWASRSRAAIYAGSISAARGLWEMLEALSAPEIPADAKLTLVGRFDDDDLAARVQRDPRWSRVDHLPWQREPDLWRLMADAKIGVVVLHPTAASTESMPMKLFEYMALGLPVVASDFPAWRAIVETNRCGLLVDPLDARE